MERLSLLSPDHLCETDDEFSMHPQVEVTPFEAFYSSAGAELEHQEERLGPGYRSSSCDDEWRIVRGKLLRLMNPREHFSFLAPENACGDLDDPSSPGGEGLGLGGGGWLGQWEDELVVGAESDEGDALTADSRCGRVEVATLVRMNTELVGCPWRSDPRCEPMARQDCSLGIPLLEAQVEWRQVRPLAIDVGAFRVRVPRAARR